LWTEFYHQHSARKSLVYKSTSSSNSARVDARR
jgi:hypothetical protein